MIFFTIMTFVFFEWWAQLNLSWVKYDTHKCETSWMSWHVLACQEHTQSVNVSFSLTHTHECECEFNSLTWQDRWVSFFRLILILTLIYNECEYNTIQSTMYRNRHYSRFSSKYAQLKSRLVYHTLYMIWYCKNITWLYRMRIQ